MRTDLANSVDPEQTTLSGPVRSGSILSDKTCLSEDLGSLWQKTKIILTYIICDTKEDNSVITHIVE